MKNILIVDDSDIVIRTLTQAMEIKGFNPITFESSPEALEFLKNEKPSIDIAIIDLIMPKMGGLTLIRNMKSSGYKFPVILCTGFRDSIDYEEAVEAGVTRILWKPVPLDELFDEIQSLLELQSTSE